MMIATFKGYSRDAPAYRTGAFTKGTRYEVLEEAHGNIAMIDDDGDEMWDHARYYDLSGTL